MSNKKTRYIVTRVSQEQYDLIDSLATECNMTHSQYLRESATLVRFTSPSEQDGGAKGNPHVYMVSLEDVKAIASLLRQTRIDNLRAIRDVKKQAANLCDELAQTSLDSFIDSANAIVDIADSLTPVLEDIESRFYRDGIKKAFVAASNADNSEGISAERRTDT